MKSLSTAKAPGKMSFGHLLPILLICIGVLLRLIQYLFNRSLWMDEAFIADNFLHRPYSELLHAPMEYTSTMTVPVGFMIVVKFATVLLGNRDIVLRLYPLLSSILALPLFYKVARAYIPQPAAVITFLLFVTSWPLIYQASEFKPYSSDVTCSIVILLISTFIRRRLTVKRLVMLAVVGALVVWFSFPVAFLLAAIGSYFIIQQGRLKQWSGVGAMVVVSAIWLISFALQYQAVVDVGGKVFSTQEWLLEFWRRRNAFMPFPFSQAILTWSLSRFVYMFLDPSGWLNFAFPIAISCYLVGIVFMAIHNRKALFIMTMPIVFASVASYFRVYPFCERMLFFLLPSIFLVVGEGIAQLSVALTLGKFRDRIAVVVLSQALLAILLFNYVPHYETREELKPVLAYVQSWREKQDKIYVFFSTEPAFRYYSSSYGLNYDDCSIIVPVPQKEFMDEISYFRSKQKLKPTSVDETQCVLGTSASFDEASRSELAKLEGTGRIWFIFSRSSMVSSEFLRYLDSMGTRLDKIIEYNASAYLYDL